jgi:hypothetical protein
LRLDRHNRHFLNVNYRAVEIPNTNMFLIVEMFYSETSKARKTHVWDNVLGEVVGVEAFIFAQMVRPGAGFRRSG